MTHGNTNCHKISPRGIWDSSRTVAHSLPCTLQHTSSHGQMKAQIMRPRWTDNCVQAPWITRSLPSPFPNSPAPLPIKFQRFFGTASPPSNCLPEFLPFFLPDAVRLSSAVCPQSPCHQPRALMGPHSPRWELMAAKTLLRIQRRAAFCLWKHLWKALCSHTFKYFCPQGCIS